MQCLPPPEKNQRQDWRVDGSDAWILHLKDAKGKNIQTYSPKWCDVMVIFTICRIRKSSHTKSKDCKGPFFKARNHQTANYLHSLKPVPEKSELWNTPFPCWVNRPIFRVYVGLVSGRVPIYTGFCPNSKNNTHTKRLQLFQNDFVFVDNFKRMALILLMEEILHHLGCIKPCK